MKPFLGIDLSFNKKNEERNGKEFLIQTPSESLTNAYDNSMQEALRRMDDLELPQPFRIIKTLLGVLLILMLPLFPDIFRHFSEYYHKNPFVLCIIALCLGLWGSLMLWSHHRFKNILDSTERVQNLYQLESNTMSILAELEVPESADSIDIITFPYKVKNGQIRPQNKSNQYTLTPYSNTPFSVFADDASLYLVDVEGKYAFPLSSIQKIQTVYKEIALPLWNKEEPYNHEIYQKYKLSIDRYQLLHCKYYYIIEVMQNDELFGIYIPSYESSVIEKWIDVQAI